VRRHSQNSTRTHSVFHFHDTNPSNLRGQKYKTHKPSKQPSKSAIRDILYDARLRRDAISRGWTLIGSRGGGQYCTFHLQSIAHQSTGKTKVCRLTLKNYPLKLLTSLKQCPGAKVLFYLQGLKACFFWLNINLKSKKMGDCGKKKWLWVKVRPLFQHRRWSEKIQVNGLSETAAWCMLIHYRFTDMWYCSFKREL